MTSVPHSLIRKATMKWENVQEVRRSSTQGSNIYFCVFKIIGSVYTITIGPYQWVNFSHFETPNSTSWQLYVTICFMSAIDVTYL